MERERLEGLGGWLILVHMYLYLAPLAYAGSILVILGSLWLSELFNSFFPIHIRASLIIFSALMLITYHVHLLRWFSRRQVTFPRRAILAFWLAPGYTLLTSVWLGFRLNYLLLANLVVAVSATAYMLSSRRVKNIFSA